MFEPTLLVVAGCNGSGKSSFSRSLVSSDFLPFDYDLEYLKFYRSLFDSEIREEMAHNMAFAELERQINEAINNRTNFCYETNFNSTPLHWPAYFRQRGFKLHMIYLCLDSVVEAKRRVNIRIENGGHYVPEDEITKRYFEGFSHLNTYFNYFDMIDLFDTSAYAKEPTYVLSIEKGTVINQNVLPHYLRILIPNIIKLTH